MRELEMIVIHCSATMKSTDYTVERLKRDHLARGFNDIGYHFYITKDGKVHECRPLEKIGAHAKGYNAKSIGICYEGGLDESGKACDTRTEAQKSAIKELVGELAGKYPSIFQICGHRDLSPDANGNGIIEPFEWIKSCPCYDVRKDFPNFMQEIVIKPSKED